MALFILCKLILQTCMRSSPVELDVWFLVGPSSTSTLYVCEQRRLVTHVISTIISWVGHLLSKHTVNLKKWQSACDWWVIYGWWRLYTDLMCKWGANITWLWTSSWENIAVLLARLSLVLSIGLKVNIGYVAVGLGFKVQLNLGFLQLLVPLTLWYSSLNHVLMNTLRP